MNTNTSSLFARATDALRDDMAANANDPAIQTAGRVMTELLRRNPEIAEKIVPEGKSLKKAMEAMKTEAGRHRNGNWACLDALSGMKVALQYYGIESITDMELVYAISESMGAAVSGAEIQPPPEPMAPVSKAVDELDIDALLGGVF